MREAMLCRSLPNITAPRRTAKLGSFGTITWQLGKASRIASCSMYDSENPPTMKILLTSLNLGEWNNFFTCLIIPSQAGWKNVSNNFQFIFNLPSFIMIWSLNFDLLICVIKSSPKVFKHSSYKEKGNVIMKEFCREMNFRFSNSLNK